MKRLVWFYRISSVSLFTLSLIVLLGGQGFRVNLTPSEPLGLWRIVKPDRPILVGDLIFICPTTAAVMIEAELNSQKSTQFKRQPSLEHHPEENAR